MIEFDKFTMELTFKESGAEIGKDYAFMGLDVMEVINQIPYYELGLESNYLDPLQSEKDITLKYQSEVLNYESPLGINTMKYNGSSVLIKGWMTEWENFKKYNTRYLGEDTKSAIEKLAIRDDLIYSDAIPGNIFQINQSNLNQCLALCTAAAKTPYWSIGRYAIMLDEPESEEEVDPLTGGEVFINTLDDTELVTEDTSLFNSVHTFRGRNTISDQDNKDQFINMLNNKRLQDIGMKYFMVASCNYEYEWPVGTKLKNNNDLYPEVKSWVVVSAYYHYRKSGIVTNIQYGGII